MTKPDLKTLLTRGVEEIIVKDHLEKVLAQGKKLRVKLGIDPTAPDLHLGHMVLLRKLRQFQDAGHKAILIIGDFTAQIGDPSGRSEVRKTLTKREVKNNLKKYLNQAGKIINLKKTEVIYNSRWFKKDAFLKIIELARASTISQLLHRADFKKRIKIGEDITMLETLYPLFQGYDSVMVKASIEIGGTDQKFNLLMGRRVQRHFKIPEQDIILTPLLEGLDGENKMSKSSNNYIALEEEPDKMFGKIMSLPDKLMSKYFETLTDVDASAGQLKKNPRSSKLLLAKTIVAGFHGQEVAVKAMANFVGVFSKKEKPKEIPPLKVSSKKINLIDLLIKAGIKSKNEARRLVTQGGVKIDDKVQNEPNSKIQIEKGIILQIGKRRFFRII